jgi:hypothetical protein
VPTPLFVRSRPVTPQMLDAVDFIEALIVAVRAVGRQLRNRVRCSYEIWERHDIS